MNNTPAPSSPVDDVGNDQAGGLQIVKAALSAVIPPGENAKRICRLQEMTPTRTRQLTWHACVHSDTLCQSVTLTKRFGSRFKNL